MIAAVLWYVLAMTLIQCDSSAKKNYFIYFAFLFILCEACATKAEIVLHESLWIFLGDQVPGNKYNCAGVLGKWLNSKKLASIRRGLGQFNEINTQFCQLHEYIVNSNENNNRKSLANKNQLQCNSLFFVVVVVKCLSLFLFARFQFDLAIVSSSSNPLISCVVCKVYDCRTVWFTDDFRCLFCTCAAVTETNICHSAYESSVFVDIETNNKLFKSNELPWFIKKILLNDEANRLIGLVSSFFSTKRKRNIFHSFVVVFSKTFLQQNFNLLSDSRPIKFIMYIKYHRD